MDIKLVIGLFFFNVLILFAILYRLKGFIKSGGNKVVSSFIFAMLLQEIHTVFLQFGHTFNPEIIAPWLRNTATMVFAIIAANLFFEFAKRLYNIANYPPKTISFIKPKVNIQRILHRQVIFFFVALVSVILFEAILGQAASNKTTPLSIDIHGSYYLLISRLISQTYIITTHLATIYFLSLLPSTSYGSRRHILVRTYFAIIGGYLIITDTFLNLFTTTFIFFFAQSSFWVRSIWSFWDSYVLIPLLICIVIAAGPSFLVSFVDHIIIFIEDLLLIRKIAWLRDTLIKYRPEVDSSEFSGHARYYQLPNQLHETLCRMAVECSDVLHILYSYISIQEVNNLISSSSEKKYDEFSIEALTVIQCIKRNSNPTNILNENTAQYFPFPTKNADSLQSLLRALSSLSTKLQNYNGNNGLL